jgi:hypothetical protein
MAAPPAIGAADHRRQERGKKTRPAGRGWRRPGSPAAAYLARLTAPRQLGEDDLLDRVEVGRLARQKDRLGAASADPARHRGNHPISRKPREYKALPSGAGACAILLPPDHRPVARAAVG